MTVTNEMYDLIKDLQGILRKHNGVIGAMANPPRIVLGVHDEKDKLVDYTFVDTISSEALLDRDHKKIELEPGRGSGDYPKKSVKTHGG